MNSQKHILMIMPLSTYEWGSINCGGVDSVCQMLTEYLVDHIDDNFRFTIIGLDPQSKTPYTGEIISLSENVDFIWLPASSKQTGFKIPGIIWQNWYVRKLLTSLKPDLVHTHFWSLLIGSGFKGKSLVTVHSYKKIARRNVGALNNFLYEKIIPLITKRRSDNVVVVGKQLQTALSNDGVNSQLVHNPIDHAYFDTSYVKHERSEIKLVTCALLTPRKKVEDSIDLLAELVSNDIDSTLAIIGPAADREYTEQLKKQVASLGLENNVAFLGKLNKTQIIQQYLNADLGVFTSSEETFGLVPLEMLAVGLPLITTEVGILQDDRSFFEGIGVQYFTDTLASESVSDLIKNHNSSQSKRELEIKFNIEHIVKKYKNLYVKIIKDEDK